MARDRTKFSRSTREDPPILILAKVQQRVGTGEIYRGKFTPPELLKHVSQRMPLRPNCKFFVVCLVPRLENHNALSNIRPRSDNSKVLFPYSPNKAIVLSHSTTMPHPGPYIKYLLPHTTLSHTTPVTPPQSSINPPHQSTHPTKFPAAAKGKLHIQPRLHQKSR